MTWAFVSWGEGHCGLYFMVEWFCLVSWRLFDGLMSNIWIMSQCDATFDLKINVGHSDLYFMVQWFCLISWRLFDIWKSYLKYWMTQNLLNKMYVGHWPSFHGPVIVLNIFKIIWWIKRHIWDNASVWHKDWPREIYVGQWPIFFAVQWLSWISSRILM